EAELMTAGKDELGRRDDQLVEKGPDQAADEGTRRRQRDLRIAGAVNEARSTIAGSGCSAGFGGSHQGPSSGSTQVFRNLPGLPARQTRQVMLVHFGCEAASVANKLGPSNVLGRRRRPNLCLIRQLLAGRPAEFAPVLLIDHAEQHLAEPIHPLGPGGAVGPCDEGALVLGQLALEIDALLCQLEQPLAAIARAGPLHHIAFAHELAQHARQALLGDAQDAEQLAHRDLRMAADEIDLAMMGAAEIALGENAVGLGGEIAIGIEQQLHCLAEFFLAQEYRAGTRLELAHSGRSPPDGAFQRAAAESSLARASTQRSPPVASSRFQNGAFVFSQSMRKWQASSAASRCAEAVSTSTMRSPGSSRPWRWMMVTSSSGQRRRASASISAICRSVMPG